ncbi:MAG TPA: fibronectin type III domain-containing protein, partial [Candidatus Glassbacteria bacterium]|nr:fibronectin type III domain-containing protein [Candidatus Glassbacteria bacterium]
MAAKLTPLPFSDLSTTSVKVNWLTDAPAASLVYYGIGTTDTTQMSGLFSVSTNVVHRIALSSLASNTDYNYYMVSDTLARGPYTFHTPALGGTPTPYILVGVVYDEDGVSRYRDALVLVKMTSAADPDNYSYYLSALTDSLGAWSVSLGNARSANTGQYMAATAGAHLSVEVYGGSELRGRLEGSVTSSPQVLSNIVLSSEVREVVALYPGLNLIGLPLEPSAGLSAYSALAGIGSANEIQRWLGETQLFDGAAYIVELEMYFGTDFALAKGEGYFLRCTAPDSLALVGRMFETPPELEFYQGLNLVSFGNQASNYSTYSLMGAVSGVNEVQRWDAVSQLFDGAAYIVELDMFFGTDFTFNSEEGYFVRATQQANFIPTGVLLASSAGAGVTGEARPLRLRPYSGLVSAVVPWFDQGYALANLGGTSVELVAPGGAGNIELTPAAGWVEKAGEIQEVDRGRIEAGRESFELVQVLGLAPGR